MKRFTGRTLQQMDTFIRLYVDDEDLFMNWIQVVPDESTEEDFYDYADDKDYCIDIAETFLSIVLCENAVGLDADIYESILYGVSLMLLETK